MICLSPAVLRDRRVALRQIKQGIKIYREGVDEDLNKLIEMFSVARGKNNQRNIKGLATHVRDTFGEEPSVTKLTLETKDAGSMIQVTPELINETIYNINESDNLFIGASDKLVTIKYRDMCDIIAYEYAHRDLGDDDRFIDKLLYGLSIISPCESKVLTDRIKEISEYDILDFYSTVKGMRVEDSPHLDKVGPIRCLDDYFMVEQFVAKKYNRALSFSCKAASSILLENIIETTSGRKIKVVPIMIGEDRVTYISKVDPAETYACLLDGVTIQAFGRKFLFDIDIEVL